MHQKIKFMKNPNKRIPKITRDYHRLSLRIPRTHCIAHRTLQKFNQMPDEIGEMKRICKNT